jgi:hypothetical protein
VDATGPANEQIQQFIGKATAGGGLPELVDALKGFISQLETRPQDWGDPKHRTRKEGGMVYQGLQRPLVVKYAVFESAKVVWVLDVRALPNTPLAE